jgi:hypothetical protein
VIVGVTLSCIGFVVGLAVSVYRWRETQKESVGAAATRNDAQDTAQQQKDALLPYVRAGSTREQAEKELADKPVGTFLVRTRPANKLNTVRSLEAADADTDGEVRVLSVAIGNMKVMHCKITFGERETVGDHVGLRTVLIDGKYVGTPPSTTLQNAIVTLYVDSTILTGGVLLLDQWAKSNDQAVYGEVVYAGFSETAETALPASEPKEKKKKQKETPVKTVCVQKTSRGPCTNVVAEETELCTDHTCQLEGCSTAKSSRVSFCTAHTTEQKANNQEQFEGFGYIEVGSEGGGGEGGIAI